MGANRRAFLGATAAGLGGLAAARADDPEPGGGKTKFAVNIEMWFRKLKFVEKFAATKKLGFDAVEFWDWKPKDLNAVADAAQANGITIVQFTAWGFTPGLNEAKNHAAFVDAVGKGCEVAKKLNVKMMCVVGGNDVFGVSQRHLHETIVDGLRKGAPIAEQAGVTLILEPMNVRVDHKGHCLYGSEPGVSIIKAVNSPAVKLLFDLYHNHITEGDLCGHLRDGFGQLGYVQVADHPGRNEPGTGEIHYNRVFKELHKLGYTGYVGLECVPAGGEEKAAERVRQADVW